MVVLPPHTLQWPQFIVPLKVKSFVWVPLAYHSFTPKTNLFSHSQAHPFSAYFAWIIMCTHHTLMIKQLVLFGRVFQLNASTKARLAGLADEKSLGEKSCKVTDQRGPPPLVRLFSTNEWGMDFSPNECEIDFSKVQKIIFSLSRVGRMDFSRSARSTDGTWRLFLPSLCRPSSTRARPPLPSGWEPSDTSDSILNDDDSPYSFSSRFRLACRGRDSSTAYLPVTVFIQDINDNPPIFQSSGLSTLFNTFQSSYSSVLDAIIIVLLVRQFLFWT